MCSNGVTIALYVETGDFWELEIQQMRESFLYGLEQKKVINSHVVKDNKEEAKLKYESAESEQGASTAKAEIMENQDDYKIYTRKNIFRGSKARIE